MSKSAQSRKKRVGVSRYFESRKSAYRAFKKDYEIPNAEQPQIVIKPDTPDGERYGLDERNVRLYIFRAIKNLFGGIFRRETHLREDKDAFYVKGEGEQAPHFNAGHAGKKLKDHYYFK
jgi:hypothetical protein